jgi:hypothetical protein
LNISVIKVKVSKLDAACSQLRTAISLWFTDGDPVSVHTLACAAYEIFHTVSEKRDPYRRDLLFDTDFIKDEHRAEWMKSLKKAQSFFKHADRDPDGELEFDPRLSEGFILYAIAGRELCGEPASREEKAYLSWLKIHKPSLLTEKGRQSLAERIPAEDMPRIRALSKRDFFEVVISLLGEE